MRYICYAVKIQQPFQVVRDITLACYIIYHDISMGRICNPITARVCKPQRVVEAVGIAVEALQADRFLHIVVRREKRRHHGVVHPAVHVNQAEVAVMFVHAETTVEGGVYVVVCECF